MSGSGQGRRDDDLHSEKPAFSDEGMRRIVYGEDRLAPDARSAAFAEDTKELEDDLRERRSLVPAVTALAAVFCFGAIVWYAYSWGTGQMDSEDLPVVLAEPMPEKTKPEQPGGMEVPHQGIAVLNEGEGGADTSQVERLLPPPEEPAPPEPAPPAALPEAAPEVALDGGEEAVPETAPVAEAPLVAVLPPEAGGTAPQDGALAETGETAEAVEAPELAESGIAVPVPKPRNQDNTDQIAALLEQAPLETADGAPSDDPIPTPPAETTAAGSAPAEPTATQSAALTPGAVKPGSVVLQLASVTSEAAATSEWARLQKAYPEQLGGRDLALDSAVVKGKTYFRIQTGPFASRAAAADLCAQLKSRNQDCLVTTR